MTKINNQHARIFFFIFFFLLDEASQSEAYSDRTKIGRVMDVLLCNKLLNNHSVVNRERDQIQAILIFYNKNTMYSECIRVGRILQVKIMRKQPAFRIL